MRYNVDGSHYAFIDDAYNTNQCEPQTVMAKNGLLDDVTAVDNNYYQPSYYQSRVTDVDESWREEDQHTILLGVA